ncbi:MAG TPA: hypothetical protein VFL59_05145 [Candidatus Nanopelagicales bacterium]|nr:hypothetical protein [Candidatus Nanopelagicales bacterium]
MWRRACLGDRDAVVAVGYLWFGVCTAVLIVAAARWGWITAWWCAAGLGAVLQAAYWLRRRRWDRKVRLQGLETVAAVELLLRQRGRG